MSTWLRLAPVGVAGLEPAASRSQSGRSTKLTYTPLCCYLIAVRDLCQPVSGPPGSSPTPRLFRLAGWRPCERADQRCPSITHRDNHIPRPRPASTRKQVNHVTRESVRSTDALAEDRHRLCRARQPAIKAEQPRPVTREPLIIKHLHILDSEPAPTVKPCHKTAGRPKRRATVTVSNKAA